MCDDPEDYDNLLDDISAINDLTRFDDLNVGHNFGDKKLRQSAVTPTDTLVNRIVGPRKDQLPNPRNVVTLFQKTLSPNETTPRGVSGAAAEGPPKTSGRGLRMQMIAERSASSRPKEVSGLDLIQQDIAKTFRRDRRTTDHVFRSDPKPNKNLNKPEDRFEMMSSRFSQMKTNESKPDQNGNRDFESEEEFRPVGLHGIAESLLAKTATAKPS